MCWISEWVLVVIGGSSPWRFGSVVSPPFSAVRFRLGGSLFSFHFRL
jgi:hypothetical protein